jgi:hypothetical protein
MKLIKHLEKMSEDKSLYLNIDIITIHGIYVYKNGPFFDVFVAYTLSNKEKMQLNYRERLVPFRTKGKENYVEAACMAIRDLSANIGLEPGVSKNFEFKALYAKNNDFFIDGKNNLPDFVKTSKEMKLELNIDGIIKETIETIKNKNNN